MLPPPHNTKERIGADRARSCGEEGSGSPGAVLPTSELRTVSISESIGFNVFPQPLPTSTTHFLVLDPPGQTWWEKVEPPLAKLGSRRRSKEGRRMGDRVPTPKPQLKLPLCF